MTPTPEETAVFPRLRMIDPQEPGSEPPTAAREPVAEGGTAKPPPGDRPADITRPQLILDDTVVDMAGWRGGWNPRQNGTAGAGEAPLAGGAAPADGDAEPADVGGPPTGKAAKRSRSVFGPEPASRPDMLTNADTVVMASLKGQKGSLAGSSAKADEAAANARNAAAVKQQATTAMVPVGTSAAFAEAVTQVLPTVEPSQLSARHGSARRLGKPGSSGTGRPPSRLAAYIPGRRTTMISRLVLLAILSLQAVLSLRLRNTAFEDESLYLYAGHMELQHLLHGAALQGQYSSYFSGSPVLYPVLAAALDQVGGLALARALSLVEMLATTVLLYSMTRRLFNERIGLCAAALFAVTDGGVPGELRHLRRHLPVPARPGRLDHGPDRRVPLAVVPARRAARRAGGRGQVRGTAVRAHHRGPAGAGRMARTRPARAVVPGGLRRRRGGPALRGAAAGRPGLHDRHLEHDHQPRPGRHPGQHHPARGRGMGRRPVRRGGHRHRRLRVAGPHRTGREDRPGWRPVAPGGARRAC